jgi:hypothetical protein
MSASYPNQWVAQSISLAQSPGYLDRLSQVYPAKPSAPRPLEPSVKKRMQQFHQSKNRQRLLKQLLELERFPFEHPYVPLLREYPELIDKNPGIVQQIGGELLKMDAEDIIRACERPPDINRQMGSAFRKWLKHYFSGKGYSFLSKKHDFLNHNGPAFLDAGDTVISQFVTTELALSLEVEGIDIERYFRRDCLAKVGKVPTYVIGEARFLSTFGGSQTRDLKETLEFVTRTNNAALKQNKSIKEVGILDGIPWLDDSYRNLIIAKVGPDDPVLSALLLEDYLQSIP